MSRPTRLLLFTLVAFGLASPRLRAQAQLPPGFSVAQPKIPDHIFNLKNYGAAADGKALDTGALKKALAAVDAAGGGVLVIPAGTYLTGPLTLVNNLELRLDPKATIRFTDDRSKFQLTAGGYEICMHAEHAHDIAITGGGTIDGNGQSWWDEFRAYKIKARTDPSAKAPHRPYLIMLAGCQRVLMRDVTLTNSPMFHFVPKECRDVTIDSVKIFAPANAPNTDGIDPSGQNFHIANCIIDTGDDNIALKPHPAPDGLAGCENFLIENMTFRHGHGMSIGGGSHGGVRNMLVRDCTFENTDAGVRMKSARDRGGLTEKLTYENLKMTDVATPIIIISYYPKVPKDIASDPARPVTDHTPYWKDILIKNLIATGATFGCRIIGLPEAHARHITLDHVDITSAKNAVQIIHADDVKFIDSKIISRNGTPNEIVDSRVKGLDGASQ